MDSDGGMQRETLLQQQLVYEAGHHEDDEVNWEYYTFEADAPILRQYFGDSEASPRDDQVSSENEEALSL